MEKLKDRITQIIDNNSGGLKFLTLLTELNQEYTELTPDHLEETIRGMSEFKILEYGMLLGARKVRIKMFVYRPLR